VVKGNFLGPMVANTKVSTRKTKNMDSVNSLMLMVAYTKVIGKMGNNTEREKLLPKMVKFITEYGKTENFQASPILQKSNPK